MHCIFVSWLCRHSDARQNMSNCLLLPLRTPSCPLDPSLKHCANTQVQHGSAPLNCRLDITHLLKKMMMNTACIQLYTYTIIHDRTVLGIIWNISGTKEKTTNPNFQSEKNTKQLLSNWPRVPKYVKMCLPCACHVPRICCEARGNLWTSPGTRCDPWVPRRNSRQFVFDTRGPSCDGLGKLHRHCHCHFHCHSMADSVDASLAFSCFIVFLTLSDCWLRCQSSQDCLRSQRTFPRSFSSYQ